MPFYGAEYTPAGLTPCCLLPKNTNIVQLREDILNDTRPIACQKCWALEDQGIISDRQIKNSAFDFYSNKDIQFIEEDCRNGKFSPQIVKFYTSNLCNGTCVTCGAGASTAWATLNKEKTFEIIDQHLLDSIALIDVIIITFVGGEPLHEKKNFELLKKLIEIGNTTCFISMTTNGSVELSTKQLDILKQFKNINLCLSIDGVDTVFEYLRYPLKWSTLIDNIELYRSMNIDLSVSYTISNLNTLYYDETIAWFNKMKLPYNHNIVSSPVYFSPTVLPDGVDNHLLDVCRAEILKQDNLKNINIQDYLPEFYKLIFK